MKKYGLFIGIDRYSDPNITPLHCAAQDARVLARHFQQKLEFDTTVITHEEIMQGRRVMDELWRIAGKLGEGDVFVLFFAGHGKTTSTSHNGSSDQLFLLPHASAKALEKGIGAGEGVLSYQAVRAETDGWRGVQRVFIFDACRLPLENSKSRDALQPARFDGEVVYRAIKLGTAHADDEEHATTPLVILNSCHDEQRAEELDQYGHGLFTASLIEVLGDYASEKQSVIVNDGLIDALAKRMQKLAREHGKRDTTQRPLRLGSEIALNALPVATLQPSPHITTLLQHFERQFAANQYTRPVSDNCSESLRQLLALGHSAPELSQRLQMALDEGENLEKRKRDQQKYEAACALNTQEAYGEYLKTCELCEQKEQAKAAIADLKQEAQIQRDAALKKPVPPVEARVEAAPVPPPKQEKPAAAAIERSKAGKNTGKFILMGIVALIVIAAQFAISTKKDVPETLASVPAPEAPATTPAPAATPLPATPVSVEPAINQHLAAKTEFQDTLQGGTQGPKMVVLPTGSFQLGSNERDDEKGGPLVTIAQKFAIGKYEITVAQYLACVDAGACKEPEWREKGSKYHIEQGTDSYYKKLGAALTNADSPIIGISWHNAKEYVAWLNKNKQDKQGQYILPSEAQWEYAARASTNTKWAHGDDEALLEKYAWYDKNSDSKPHAVGTRAANAFGLHDIHGNVWEWVEDCYHTNYQGAPNDGSVWQKDCQKDDIRVLRGGAWGSSAAVSRSAIRNFNRPEGRGNGLGFRVARTLP